MGGGQGNPATSGLACSPDIPKDAYLGLEKGLRFLSEKLPPPPRLDLLPTRDGNKSEEKVKGWNKVMAVSQK